MIGREVVDYARLLERAGVLLRKRNAGKAWIGDVRGGQDGAARIGNLQAPGTPAYEAGLEQDDTITEIDGKPVTSMQQVTDAIASHKPGDTVSVAFKRRNGVAVTSKIVLKEDPALDAVLVEEGGGTLSPQQKAIRDAWLGSKQH
jgi:predicted metalloprotease with PDZ domain